MKAWLPIILLLILFSATRLVEADSHCSVAMAQWQHWKVAIETVQSRGWRVTSIKIHDGCYEVVALDSMGRSVEIKINPETLLITALDVESGN